jgi:thiol-disulfide isomerase/thioredoxin
MKAWLASLLALVVTACAGAPPAPRTDAHVTVVSLDRLDCAACGAQIVSDLRASPGVYEAKFDKQRAEIAVTASPSFDVFTAVRKLSAREGADAILGAGKGRYLESPQFPEGADVKLVVIGGEDVPDLGAVVAKGKVTVVDFTAIWCRSCREVDKHMAGVLGRRRDVAYRRLEIGDWDTPLAKRYLKDVPQLPYVIVYGSTGTKVGEVSGVALGEIDAAIQRGAPPP